MIKRRINITDPRVIQAVEMYKAGKGVKPVCKELRMDGTTLNRFLVELGLKRTHAEVVRGGKSAAVINDHALDVLTPEALYWIGFMYADGHIPKDRPRISLTLSVEDKSHLTKFAKFFGENIPITHTVKKGMASNGYVSNDAFRVQFSSKALHQKLLDLGFTNRKTWDITPHYLLKYSRDFWRGVVDGDGCLWHKKYKDQIRYCALSLSGNEKTLEDFLSFVKLSGVEPKAKVRKEPKREFLWTLTFSSGIGLAVANLLYKDAPIYLDRKYEKYLSWIDPNNEMNKKLSTAHASH